MSSIAKADFTGSPTSRSKAPKALFTAAVFLTLVGLFYTIENWRGRRAWQACRQDLLARGEQLDLKAFMTPPIPDAQNFLKVFPLEVWFSRNSTNTNALALMPRLPKGLKSTPPSLAELKTWSQFANDAQPGSDFPVNDRAMPPAAALLKWFEKYDTGLRALYEAGSRKGTRFDGDYTRGIEMEVPNYVAARQLAQAMGAHAEANLLVGKPEEAMRDLTVIDHMARAFRSSPTLVGTMIGVAISGYYEDIVQQGLAEHLWHPEQWASIQEQSQGCNFIADYNRAMRGGEMANLLQFLQSASRAKLLDVLVVGKGWDKIADTVYYRFAPRGWIDQNMVRYARLISESMQTVDVDAGRVYPAKCPEVETRIYNETRRTPYHYVLACVVPNMVKALQRVTERQSQADLTTVACAMERCRSAEGAYPNSLDALIPKYLSRLPLDHVNGQPLNYRKTEDGRCLVYSIGWDMVDDGGGAGDWAWASPKN